MKKILALSLIALFVAGVVYAGGPTLPYAGDVMGMKTGRVQYDPHRTFRLVHFGDNNVTSGGPLLSGSAVMWDTTLDDGVSITVYSTYVSSDSRVAGLLVSTITSGDTAATLCNYTATEDAGITSRWGWLQTYGLAADDPICRLPTGISVSAGDAVGNGELVGDGLNGYRSYVTEMITGVGWSPTGQGKLGFAMDDGTTETDLQIFVTCE